jgi:hypothetical protein
MPPPSMHELPLPSRRDLYDTREHLPHIQALATPSQHFRKLHSWYIMLSCDDQLQQAAPRHGLGLSAVAFPLASAI